jgi:hypothetical protein
MQQLLSFLLILIYWLNADSILFEVTELWPHGGFLVLLETSVVCGRHLGENGWLSASATQQRAALILIKSLCPRSSPYWECSFAHYVDTAIW